MHPIEIKVLLSPVEGVEGGGGGLIEMARLIREGERLI